MRFTKINKSILKKTHNNYNNICPDEWVGKIIISGNKVDWQEKWIKNRDSKKTDMRRNFNHNNLIGIILESPHNDEFDRYGKALGPARGKTGINLEDYLIDKLEQFQINNNGKIPSGIYKIILINSIQYKCSLGFKTSVIRDRVWLNTWLNGGANCFLKRILNYKPKVVINLCTMGNHSMDPLYCPNYKIENISIRYNFLKNINKKFVQTSKGSIMHKGKRYYYKKYTYIDNNSGLKLNKLCYPLTGFVQSQLFKYKRFISIYYNKSPIFIRSYHPSSAIFINNSFSNI